MLDKAGLKISDIDVFEIHEAFAVSFVTFSFSYLAQFFMERVRTLEK